MQQVFTPGHRASKVSKDKVLRLVDPVFAPPELAQSWVDKTHPTFEVSGEEKIHPKKVDAWSIGYVLAVLD